MIISKPHSRQPDIIDEHVGRRVRMKRSSMGLSQKELAEMAGVTYQQLQKYEWGKNRISASRLFAIGRVLNEPVAYFFREMPGYPDPDDPTKDGTDVGRPRESNELLAEAQMRDTAETLALVRAYYGIRDSNVRKQMLNILKEISAADRERTGEPTI